MKHVLILALTVSSLALAGCGTKPSSPEQPGHAKTYPNMKTDPAPRGGAVHTLPQ
ncbi:MAG: hypothetical protein LRZ85_06515 [Alphaproteobacteria bacterium]|nr:hypothetical protein [Alphaproteobacteria bacterium]MCD8520160.1 hypothetical protein [Alphaproteobacteria bacterium]MCD8526383.1 hypothetical protein [Alphaproteobacteria bacterium]MCD8571530.1 hypothetical protein [Alphaproteobacteria bacterium]